MKSLPENLYVKHSAIPEAGMGVFAKEKLEVNTRFGPYRGVKVLKEDLEEGRNTSYMWEVLKKRRHLCMTGLVFRRSITTLLVDDSPIRDGIV